MYHSSDVGGLKILEPQILRKKDGFSNGETGVWATDNIEISKLFGINAKRFSEKGGFCLNIDKKGKIITLKNFKLDDIPDDFCAFVYYLDSKGFERIDKWQYLNRKPVKVLKQEAYNLKEFLRKNFTIKEILS